MATPLGVPRRPSRRSNGRGGYLLLPVWKLPAPALPAAGTGTAVVIPTGGAGTSAAPSLLTQQTANWTFTYTHPPATPAGSYSGTVTFTATAL